MNSKRKKLASRTPISLREWAVFIFASLTLGFSAWGFAGVISWTLHVMLTGGLLTLFFALAPLPGGFSVTAFSQFSFPKKSFRRLFTWPAFWFSFLFLLYLVIQALNPSITVVHGEEGWWVERMKPPLAEWLPTSVRSTYEPMNAFRVLEWFAASFLLMWGVWAGITRRKVAMFLLWALVINGSAMGFVAILQYLSEADKVLWTLKSSNDAFWGSFFYRNQGVAYLNLILIATGFLYFYHSRISEERGFSSGPHFILFVLFMLVIASVGLAISRGGIIFGSVLLVTFIVGLLFKNLVIARNTNHPFSVSIIVILLLGSGAFTMLSQIDVGNIESRFEDFAHVIQDKDKDTRFLASKATFDMASAEPIYGWGAGSFRYIFPIFQKEYDELFHSWYSTKRGWIGRYVYHYAHNDILQFWAEYGYLGTALLVLVFLALLFPIMMNLNREVLSALFLLVGVGTIIAHATIEFILNSPAYWVALIGFLVASAKLMRLERIHELHD